MKKPSIKNYKFEEKKSTLSSRIDAHKKYSKREINDWILEIILLKDGEKILDVGCGTGKQTIPYKKSVGTRGLVIGIDISEELINEAKEKAINEKLEIQFMIHDANNRFNFPDDFFDVISCCFAIYYVQDIEKIIIEFKRLLKSGGRLFLAGPTPENAKLLRDLHQEVSKKPLPYMPGVSRFMSEVLSHVKKNFQTVKIKIFQNPLIFEDEDSFLNYYTSTGLFLNTVKEEEERKEIKDKMNKKVQNFIQKKRNITILKEVGGILAIK